MAHLVFPALIDDELRWEDAHENAAIEADRHAAVTLRSKMAMATAVYSKRERFGILT